MNMKRFRAVLMALLLLAAMLPAGAEEASPTLVMAGFDGRDTLRKWEDNRFFAQMRERTGLSLTFRQYPAAEEWTAAKAGMTADGAELPDILFKAALTREEEQKLYEAGVLLDLRPLLDKYCPNLTRLMADHPEIGDAITLPGGQIVSLPYVSFASVQNGMWINRKWLNQLKLDAPTDVSSLEKVLRAFKTRDPNGNGRQDEIPLAFLGVFDLHFLSHAFGFVMNDYHLYEDGGRAVFAPLTENYMAMIRWLRDMYAEGLLDQNGFYTSDNLRAVTNKDSAQVYGMFFNTSLTNLVPTDWMQDYQLLMPFICEGKQQYRALWSPVITGTYAVTTACARPDLALRWVDELYSESGAVLASLGQENVDYVIDGDGTWRTTDRISAGTSYVAETLINSGVTAPGMSSDTFQTRYSDAAVAQVVRDTIALNDYCRLPFPAVSLTAEQSAFILPLQNAIGQEADLQASRWIIGEDALTDESAAAFRTRLDELGLEQFMSFWQERLDEMRRTER